MTEKELDPTLVTVGQPSEGGCVFTCFEENPTLPTDAETALGPGWVSLGEISENGFTEAEELTTTEHTGWHGTPVLTTEDKETSTFKLEFLEVNRPAAAKVRYGSDNVELDTDGEIKHISKKPGKRKPLPFVVEELESNGYKRRTVVPKASVKSLDDIPHKKGNLMLYGMAFTATDAGNGPYDIYRAKPAGDNTVQVSYPEGTPNDTWTVPQIEAYAAAKNISLTGCTTKAEKLAAVTTTE